MADIRTKVKLQDANALAQGYSSKVRYLEVSAIIAFAVMMAGFVWRIAPHASENWWVVLAALLCGYLAADFARGFVPGAGDTGGSTPPWLVGKARIRPSREHHDNMTSIPRHDFVETNGNNCLISLPCGLI